MAGQWTDALQQRMSRNGPPSAPRPGMGGGGVPYAAGLMARPQIPAANPGSMGPGTGQMPQLPQQNSAPTGGMTPGQGMPGMPIGGPGGSSPQAGGGQELQNAAQMAQQLVAKFMQLAQRNRMNQSGAGSFFAG